MPFRRGSIACVLALACRQGSDAEPSASKDPDPAAVSTASSDAWRYRDELAAAAGRAATATVLELSRGDEGRAWVVAAVQRTGDPLPPVTVEVWTFAQQGDNVSPAGEAPRALLRTDASDPIPEAHPELRRQLAAPGAVLRRPLGLPVDRPADLLPRLATLARATAEATDATARADAMAELLRGIDDALLFERDRLPEVLALLRTDPLAAGDPISTSARRVTVPVAGHTIELWRKSDGWVLAALD